MQINKKVLILGANSDIAKHIAVQMLKKNYKLTLLSRNISSVKNFLKKFNFNLNLVEFITMDLKEVDKFETYFQNLQIKHDIFISAVGELNSSFENGEKLFFDDILNNNYVYPSKCIEIIANCLAEEKSLNEKIILGISSVAGERGRSMNFHYGAAKSAFTVFLSGLRQKLSDSKIIVITVVLGFVETKMTKNLKIAPFLNTKPEKIAQKIIKCIERKQVFFIPLRWRIIMFVIKLIPERIFKNLKF